MILFSAGVLSMSHNDEIRLVITTIDSRDKAKDMAKEIIKQKLAACVSISSVESIYYWQGKIMEDNEFMLIIKTSRKRLGSLRKWLTENHTYDTPEIVSIKAEANEKYLNWLLSYVESDFYI